MAWFSDRQGTRSPFVFVCLCFVALGFIITISASGRHLPGLVYAGVFIAVCGIYPAFPGNVTWLSNNLSGSYKRAAGMAIQIGLGNLGGGTLFLFFFPFERSPELGFIRLLLTTGVRSDGVELLPGQRLADVQIGPRAGTRFRGRGLDRRVVDALQLYGHQQEEGPGGRQFAVGGGDE